MLQISEFGLGMKKIKLLMECRILKKASEDLFSKCTYFYVRCLAFVHVKLFFLQYIV